jgi:hypothetical protein
VSFPFGERTQMTCCPDEQATAAVRQRELEYFSNSERAVSPSQSPPLPAPLPLPRPEPQLSALEEKARLAQLYATPSLPSTQIDTPIMRSASVSTIFSQERELYEAAVRAREIRAASPPPRPVDREDPSALESAADEKRRLMQKYSRGPSAASSGMGSSSSSNGIARPLDQEAPFALESAAAEKRRLQAQYEAGSPRRNGLPLPISAANLDQPTLASVAQEKDMLRKRYEEQDAGPTSAGSRQVHFVATLTLLNDGSYSTMPVVSSVGTSMLPNSVRTLHSVTSQESLQSLGSMHRDPTIKQGKQRQTSVASSSSLPLGAKKPRPLQMPAYQEEGLAMPAYEDDGLTMPAYDQSLPMPSYDEEFGVTNGAPKSNTMPSSRRDSSFDAHGFQEKRRHSSILE